MFWKSPEAEPIVVFAMPPHFHANRRVHQPLHHFNSPARCCAAALGFQCIHELVPKLEPGQTVPGTPRVRCHPIIMGFRRICVGGTAKLARILQGPIARRVQNAAPTTPRIPSGDVTRADHAASSTSWPLGMAYAHTPGRSRNGSRGRLDPSDPPIPACLDKLKFKI